MTRAPDRPTLDLFAQAQRLEMQGRGREAASLYDTVLRRAGDFPPALLRLGQVLDGLGERAAAHALLRRAARAGAAQPEVLREALPRLAAVVGDLVPAAYDPEVERDLLACFDAPGVDAQRLALVTARLLLLRDPDPAPERMGRDPLWLAFLTRTINVSPRMEERLAAMRRWLLGTFAERALPPATGRAVVAIALQAFAGQYAWAANRWERRLAHEPVDPLLAAMYRPLVAIGPEAAMRRLRRDRLTGLLVARTLAEPLEEAQIAAAMPAIGEATHPVSADVRAQYEAHPYPRWGHPPQPPVEPLGERLARLPGVSGAALPGPVRDVLIAGCGTGYEAIGVARGDPALAITAVDLSAASLAYGKRQAEELGLGTIRFVRGDLLEAQALGATFDVIYATGVLHHMADPRAGLRALEQVLRPGGAIRLGLYSRWARGAVRAARRRIAATRWPADDPGIRAFRAELLSLPPEHPMAALREADDFYSLSGCRDLAFHVQEHQHDLPQIGEMLAQAGLRQIGLELDAGQRGAFAQAFGAGADPRDMGLWDVLERQEPMLFAGMYLVWAQKA